MTTYYRFGRLLISAILCAFVLVSLSPVLAQRARTVNESPPSLVVSGPEGAVVWVDRLRYGTIGSSGEILIYNLRPGTHSLRSRLKGKREISHSISVPASSTQRTTLKFTVDADKPDLHFQEAEELREAGKHKEAIKEYRLALSTSKRAGPSARIGRARSLMANAASDAAMTQARLAIKESGGKNPEAYTVMGTTRRLQGLLDFSIENYLQALEEANGFSPEARTGLALAYQDRNRSDEAIEQYQIAARQANGTEPVIYYLLGTSLERQMRLPEAIEAYDKYLELEPNSRQANSLKSILKQLRRMAQSQ